MSKIAEIHNWLADKDFIWWPFSFMKPEPNELMTISKTNKMTLFFAGSTFLLFMFLNMMDSGFSLKNEFYRLIVLFVSFNLWFNLVTKPLWNIRAKKILARKL